MSAYLVNGKSVSREEFLQDARGIQAGDECLPGQASAGWPRLSNSIGVHPSQINEAMEKSRRQGCPLTFNAKGQAIIEGPGHQRQLRRLGIVDNGERCVTQPKGQHGRGEA